MESYRYLLDVALILFGTKVFGLLTRRIEIPQVVGTLVAGLLLGSACSNIVQGSESLNHITEIGAVVLIFSAGLETDIPKLKKSGRNGFVIAVIGVLVPLIAGYVLAPFFNTGPTAFLQSMFTGVILTATSADILVEVLEEVGELSTPSGNATLEVTLIDNILGIVTLTIITGIADTSVQLTEIMLKVVAFFVLTIIADMFVRRGIEKLFDRHQKVHRHSSVLSFAFCLLFAYVAEALFGVADITSIFTTGLTVSGTSRCNYVQTRIGTLSYLLISPVFSVSIGLKAVLPETSTSTMIFSVLLLVLTILIKIVGCGLRMRLCRYENIQSLRVGIGMVSRGEVALTVASKRVEVGLMNEVFFGPVIIMAVLTTVIAPVLLKIVFKDRENDPDVYTSSELIENYEKIEQNEKLV